jgi:uncharacterized membrane protein
MRTQQDMTASGGVRSTVHLFGHPVHPMLIPFPLALLIAAGVSDVVFLVDGDDFWARASMWLIASGVVTGAVAAVAGLIDFLTIPRARNLSGWIHFLGNAAVLVISLINWLLRIGDPGGFVEPWGLVLSVVTVVLLGVTGWTGGELAYRHQIGVTGRSS